MVAPPQGKRWVTRFPTVLLRLAHDRTPFGHPVQFTEDTVMKARMLLFFVAIAGTLVLASPGYSGVLVAQPNGPSVSGDGKPDDWDSPNLTPLGRPTDWDSPRLTTHGRPTEWGSTFKPNGRPEDWGSRSAGYAPTFGRPTDWESPFSFGSPWALIFQSLLSTGEAF